MVSEDHVHPLLDYMILAHGGVVSAFDLANLEVGSQASSQHAESMPSHNGTAQDRPQNHLVPASGDHKRVFTLFPYFPPELHFYVWEQTCPPPRLVSLGLSTARYQKGSRASNGDDKTWVVRVKYSADSPLHGAKVLSESCIETRNAFARKYQRLEVFPPVSGFTTESWIGLADWLPVLPVTVSCTSYIEPYIDFENDTLHLDFDQYISLLAHGCSIDMSRVTRLAFDAKTTSNPHDDFFEVFLRHISALPALKHFSFILNDLGGAHPIDKEREKMEKVLVDMDWTFLDSESWGFTDGVEWRKAEGRRQAQAMKEGRGRRVKRHIPRRVRGYRTVDTKMDWGKEVQHDWGEFVGSTVRRWVQWGYLDRELWERFVFKVVAIGQLDLGEGERNDRGEPGSTPRLWFESLQAYMPCYRDGKLLGRYDGIAQMFGDASY